MGARADFKDEGTSRHDGPDEDFDDSFDDQSLSYKRQLVDIDLILSKPTWSVRSLLPDPNLPPEDEITSEKLHHLLRLSALPLPTSPAAEAKMLETLHSQLHFVRDIQKVNTDGVEPLRSIRDETEEGMQEVTIGIDQLKDAFASEAIKGRNKRPRRRRGEAVNTKGVEDWDVLGTASEMVEMSGARYFVVRSGKGDHPNRAPVDDGTGELEKVYEEAEILEESERTKGLEAPPEGGELSTHALVSDNQLKC